jgi:hypothetical protein
MVNAPERPINIAVRSSEIDIAALAGEHAAEWTASSRTVVRFVSAKILRTVKGEAREEDHSIAITAAWTERIRMVCMAETFLVGSTLYTDELAKTDPPFSIKHVALVDEIAETASY